MKARSEGDEALYGLRFMQDVVGHVTCSAHATPPPLPM